MADELCVVFNIWNRDSCILQGGASLFLFFVYYGNVVSCIHVNLLRQLKEFLFCCSSIQYFLVIMQMGLSIGKAQKWWEKGLQPNMREITSAEDLVDSLLTAGDTLVVVDFFSPGCGGCRALHPKVPYFNRFYRLFPFIAFSSFK